MLLFDCTKRHGFCFVYIGYKYTIKIVVDIITCTNNLPIKKYILCCLPRLM